MNILIDLNHHVWPGALTAALAIVASSVTFAQQAPTAASAPAMVEQAAKTNPTAFRSALDGYQPYSEEKIVSWKEANDITARIGGWRAYAEEASRTESEPPAPARNPGAKP